MERSSYLCGYIYLKVGKKRQKIKKLLSLRWEHELRAVTQWSCYSVELLLCAPCNGDYQDHNNVVCWSWRFVSSKTELSPSFGVILSRPSLGYWSHVTSESQSDDAGDGCRPITDRPCYSSLLCLSHRH